MNLVVALAISGSVLMAQGGSPGEVRAVRYSVIGETTRLAIEVSREFEYQTNQLHNPERVYFDILNAKPRIDAQPTYSKNYAGKLVSRLRVAERTPNVTRVVVDLREPVRVAVSRLANPARLVIELRPEPVPPIGPVTAEPIREAARPIPVQGLALNISSASAGPGGVAQVVISLDAPPGKEPLALQWDLSYASPQLGLENEDLVIGSAAKSPGKSLACTGRAEGAGTYIYRCILQGGTEGILTGPVALITFHVRTTARLGPTSVRLDNALGVRRDGAGVSIQQNQAEVIIR